MKYTCLKFDINMISEREDPELEGKRLVDSIQRLHVDMNYFIEIKRQQGELRTLRRIPENISECIQEHDKKRINRLILESAINFKKKKIELINMKLKRWCKANKMIKAQIWDKYKKGSIKYGSRKEEKLNKKYLIPTIAQQKERFDKIVINKTAIVFDTPEKLMLNKGFNYAVKQKS